MATNPTSSPIDEKTSKSCIVPEVNSNLNTIISQPLESSSLETPTLEVSPLYALRATSPSCDTIKLHFSENEYVDLVLGENLFISPAIEDINIYHRWWDEAMFLQGEFLPETEYTITIKEGTKTSKGQTLLNETKLNVTTPVLAPDVSFLTYMGQMALTPETSLAYKYRGCEELTITVWRAFSNNLITFGLSSWNDHLLEKHTTKTFRVPLNKTQTQDALLPIYDLVNGTPGVYRFVISSKENKYDECYILLSNIGATYAYDHRFQPIVAVQDLRSGKPIENANVAIYDEKHQCIAIGTSNAQGLATTSPTLLATTRKESFKPERIIITAENDMTLLNVDATTSHQAYQATLNKPTLLPTYLWPDRDGLHLGESVTLYGMIRTAALTAAKNIPLSIRLYTPNNLCIATEPVLSNDNGYFKTMLNIPEGAASGYYTASVWLDEDLLDETHLYVADFTANHVKVELNFIDENPETLMFTAKTYFGSPVVKGNGNYTITAEEAPQPESWESWTVGTQRQSNKLLSESFTKDSKEANMQLLGVSPSLVKDFFTPVLLRATLSFNEPNSRAVSDTTTVIKAFHSAYLGLRYNELEQSLEMKQLAYNGNVEQEGILTDFTITKKIYTYELVKDGSNWRYKWMEYDQPITLENNLKLLSESSLKLKDDDIVATSLKELSPGHYTISACLNDSVSTSLTFWHQTSELGKHLSNPSNLVFSTDKPSYKPGDIATLSFQAPTGGRLIITTGDTEIQRCYTAEVSPGIHKESILIPQNCTHGQWHVGITLVSKDVEKDSRYFGMASLKIDHSDKKIMVSINAPKVVQPKETLTLNVKLADSNGKPCKGTIALFAVDESILDVTGFKTPNPHEYLFQKTGSTFTFGDLYSTLLPQLHLGPDGRIGGDKDVHLLNNNLAHNKINISKKTTVITLPIQTIDASGQCSIPVTLPEFTGTLRFMAIAANETMVGSSDTSVIVRPPATLTLSGVRYGCLNDNAVISARIINHDLPEQPYTLTIGNETFNGVLATGATAYHSSHMPVENITANLTMGTFSTTATHNVSIQDEIPSHNVVTIHHLNEGETLPQNAVLLPSLIEAREIALDWLAAYPYKCTEQLSARMLPYTNSTNEGERVFVKNLFNQLMARYLPTGQFTLWQESREAHTIATLVASHVLIDGHKAGILPANQLPTILKSLQITANSTAIEHRGEAAYAAFLLGEAGAKTQALHAARNLLIVNETDMAAFFAATTLVLNGAADEGAPKMRQFLDANKCPKPLISEYMDDATTQAMVLTLAIRAGICTETEIEERLSVLLDTPWTTTQANAWVAHALAACNELPSGTLYRMLTQTNVLKNNPSIQVTKYLINRDAQPITTLKHGELGYIIIKINLPRTCKNLVIRDRLPGGLEYEDSNLATRESSTLPESIIKNNLFIPEAEENLGAELRFFGQANAGETTLIYPVRATTKGTFAIPAVVVEDMYNIDCIGGNNPEGTLSVK